MKRIFLILLICLSANIVAQDKERYKAADELLKTLNSEKLIKVMLDQFRPMLLQQYSSMGLSPKIMAKKQEIIDIIFDIMEEEFKWDKIKDDMITIYADVYTTDELNELNEFFKTPIGQKYIEKTPEIMQKSMAFGQKIGQKIAPRLMQVLQEQIKKIKVDIND